MSLDSKLIVQEQARQLFQAATSSSVAQILVVTLLYSILHTVFESSLLSLGVISIATLSLARIFLSRQYVKKQPVNAAPWLNLFTLITSLIGISWACLSLLYLSTDDVTIQAVFLIIICGVMSASVPVLSSWTPAYFAMTVPQFITFFLILIYQGEAYNYFFAACLLVYYIMLISLQRNTNHNIKKSFKLEHKNDELVSQLNIEIEQREYLIADRTHELHDNLKRLDFALGAAHQGWFDLNIQTGEITVSDEYPRLLGYEPHEFHSNFQEWQDNIHPDDLGTVLSSFQKCIEIGGPKEIEYRRRAKDNQWLWLHTIGEVIEWNDKNQATRLVGIHRDITEQRESDEALEESEVKFRTLFDSTTDAVMLYKDGAFLDGNKATLELFGCTSVEELCTKSVGDVSPKEQSCGTNSSALAHQHIALAIENGSHNFEWEHKRLDTGETFPADVLLSPLTIHGQALIQATVRNITERKKSEEKLNLMAHFDSLTKLPNRVLFSDRFNQAVAHSNRTNSMLAICFLDLDNFKPINDNFGHDIGDLLLIEVANRLKMTIREEDTASRQGGDEFTLLLRDIESFSQCEQLLNRVRQSLAQPYNINGHTLNISISLGSTIFPLDNSDLGTLLRHADQAMYQAKLAGKDQLKLFNALNDQEIVHKQTQCQEIALALTNKEFCLYYQPKVNMSTGEVFGVEALIRWIHPGKGLIPPSDFLPLIASSDLEIQIGGWVINEALQQLHEWQLQGIKLEVSINISSHHLQSPAFFDQLNEALSKFPDVDSQNVQLEILESSALGDIETIGGIIKSCQNVLGVNVALDDFGTGYSSLTHIRNLSANTIKIDQSFVRDLLDNPHDYSIIEGVIGLAHAFNRKVIAEGVESEAHGIVLLIMGCYEAQGYNISRPLPADDIPSWLSSYQPNQSWLNYSNEQHTEQEDKIKLLQLTTKHWFQHVNNALLTMEDSGFGEFLVKCHLGKWLSRFKDEAIFDENWLEELQKSHDRFYLIAENLIALHHAGNIEESRKGMESLRIAYENVDNLLSGTDSQRF